MILHLEAELKKSTMANSALESTKVFLLILLCDQWTVFINTSQMAYRRLWLKHNLQIAVHSCCCTVRLTNKMCLFLLDLEHKLSEATKLNVILLQFFVS